MGLLSFTGHVMWNEFSRTVDSVGRGSAAASRQLEAARRHQAKVDYANELQGALVSILNIHRETFRPARAPERPPSPTVDANAIHNEYRRLAIQSTSAFQRAARKAALAEARQNAEVAVAQAMEDGDRASGMRWRADKAKWDALRGGDVTAVTGELESAFADNDAAAFPLYVESHRAVLGVRIPGYDAVPSHKPSTTPAGNLSLKRLTISEMHDFYNLMVTGYLIVTLKEAFAVGPSLETLDVIALRTGRTNSYGKASYEILAVGRCGRASLNGVLWSSVDATDVFNDCFDEKAVLQKGSSKQLQPMDLNDHPIWGPVVGLIGGSKSSESLNALQERRGDAEPAAVREAFRDAVVTPHPDDSDAAEGPPEKSTDTATTPRRREQARAKSFVRDAVTVFAPANTEVVGTEDSLGLLAVSDQSAIAAVQAEVFDVIETEGPVEVGRLATIVCRRFDLRDPVWDYRVRDITELVPPGQLRESQLFGDFAWPSRRDPDTWTGFRPADAEASRNLDEVAPEEIANAMQAVLDDDSNVDTDDLLRRTAEQFGVTQLDASARGRLQNVHHAFLA